MTFLLGSREIIIIFKYLENLCLIKSYESYIKLWTFASNKIEEMSKPVTWQTLKHLESQKILISGKVSTTLHWRSNFKVTHIFIEYQHTV